MLISVLSCAVLWTKSRYFGNLVTEIATRPRDYKPVPSKYTVAKSLFIQLL